MFQGDGDAQLAEANLDYRRQVESELLAKINTALGPLLGPDRFHASVNADCDFSSSEENEETVDPAKSAILTSQTTEESTGGAIGGRDAGHCVEPATANGTRQHRGLRALPDDGERVLPAQPDREAYRVSEGNGAADFDRRSGRPDRSLGWRSARRRRRMLVPPSAEVLKGVHDMVAGITGFTETARRSDYGRNAPVREHPRGRASHGPCPRPPDRRRSKFNFKQPSVIGGAVAAGSADCRSGLPPVAQAPRRAAPKTSSPAAIAARCIPAAVCADGERRRTARWKSRFPKMTPSRRSSKPRR